MQRIYLKDRSFAFDTLPSEASLLVDLMDLCSNDEATFEMYASAIKRDSGLTAQFLKIANSPLYRQWNEVNELKRMLIVLGMSNVRKIIITSVVQNFFSTLIKQNDKLIYRVWLRSLVCAHLAERLARKINFHKTEEAYLAGLLHQIGILLFLINYKDNYRQVLKQYDEVDDYRELERTNYGIDHCEIGATLIENWQLDSLMSDAVLFQFSETNELLGSPALLKIIAVARSLAATIGEDPHEQDLEKAEQLLNLPADSTLESLADALGDSHKILSNLGITDDDNFAEAATSAKTEKLRQQKTTELAERIKYITLTYCVMGGKSQNLESLVKEVRMNFELLFNQHQLVFLNRDGDRLLPLNDLKTNKLDEIKFSLNDQNSAIVKCLTTRTALDSVNDRCSIADNQIIRVMGAECGYFLPVFSDTAEIGVLAIGSSRKQLAAVSEKRPLVQLLLAELANKYMGFRSAEAPETSISLTEFNKIVHEVKNPLTIINNYLYILGKKLEENHPAKEEINFINEEMERVGSILNKAKNREPVVSSAEKTDINKLLGELNNFFRNSLYQEKSISCNLDLDSSIPPLKCPESKLKQVFINIIKNAVEAFPQSGELNITTRDNCFLNGNQYVEISIKDNGPGIPTQVLQKLFTPVESSKKGHAGLGLSIVGDLINEISGTISCYSSQGKGTEFKILLPRLTTEA